MKSDKDYGMGRKHTDNPFMQIAWAEDSRREAYRMAASALEDIFKDYPDMTFEEIDKALGTLPGSTEKLMVWYRNGHPGYPEGLEDGSA